MLWLLMFGTKGEELADNIGPDRVEAGAGVLFGDGLDTERLLKTADTPSPNSKSGEMLRGVFQTTPPVPGSGRVEGWTILARLTRSV